MSTPYRSLYIDVHYDTPLNEAVLLARTSQRRLGLSRAQLAQGRTVAVAMYETLRTPISDDIMTALSRIHICERTCG